MNRTQLFIVAGVGLILLILALVIFGPGRKPPAPEPATLEFWGIEDDEELWQPIIEKFEKEKPHLKVSYRRFDSATYEETLINRLAESKGPDIFVLGNSWVTKHLDKIFPFPQDFFGYSSREFKRAFADIAAADLVTKDSDAILGFPFFVDTLGLFYNKDVFNGAGIAEPPEDWDEAVEISKKLTRLTPGGSITRSGLALGSAKNVEHDLEIVSALMLQNGDPIIDQETHRPELGGGARNAFQFYTSFADSRSQNFSFSQISQNSLNLFATGEAAMAIGFSRDIPRILAKNPHLSLGVAPFPQPKNARTSITYGDYFFPTVSKFSKNPGPAWEFILYITLGEGAGNYAFSSRRPPARRDLIGQKAPAEELGVFYRQALTARSWPIPDEKATRRVFQEAIESVVTRATSVEEALLRLKEQLRLLIP